jgi:hypothetical protein
VNPIRYRYEYKYLINPQIAAILRGRGAGIMQPDAYADENGGYTVYNIYLDDRYDTFYQAKHKGCYSRDKYRLRYYNGDLSFIRLERKHKDGILSYKESLPVSPVQFERMVNGDFDFILEEKAPLWQRLATVYRLRGLRPTAAFVYRRETLVYKPGNVRFTFDGHPAPFRGTAIPNYERPAYPMLLEVKYTAFLPEVIQRLLGGLPLTHTEMSKYTVARDRNFCHTFFPVSIG